MIPFSLCVKISTVDTCSIFLVHYSVDGHVVCFCFLAFVNSAAVDMNVQVSLWHVDLEWEST